MSRISLTSTAGKKTLLCCLWRRTKDAIFPLCQGKTTKKLESKLRKEGELKVKQENCNTSLCAHAVDVFQVHNCSACSHSFLHVNKKRRFAARVLAMFFIIELRIATDLYLTCQAKAKRKAMETNFRFHHNSGDLHPDVEFRDLQTYQICKHFSHRAFWCVTGGVSFSSGNVGRCFRRSASSP